KRMPGTWFGWSGRVTPRSKIETQSIVRDRVTYIVCDLAKEDYQEYYNGFANRVLWPILHYQVDRAEFSRRDLTAYLRVHDHLPPPIAQRAQAGRPGLGPRLSPDAAGQSVARSWSQEPNRLLPAHSMPTARNPHRPAASRAAHPIALRLRSRRFPDRRRRLQFQPLSCARMWAAQPRFQLSVRRPHDAGRRIPGRHRNCGLRALGAAQRANVFRAAGARKSSGTRRDHRRRSAGLHEGPASAYGGIRTLPGDAAAMA